MNITIKKEVFKKHPKLKLLFFHIKDCNNKQHLKEAKHLLQETEKLTSLQFDKATVKNHLFIEFGKPHHYHTSAEKLIQKALKRKTNAANNTTTNLFNYLSLKYIIPGGVDDYHKISKNLTFALTTGKERKKLLKTCKKGDLYYYDNDKILATKLDHWQNSKTKPTPYSAELLIHFDILPPVSSQDLQELKKEATSLLKSFTNGKVSSFVLTKTKNKIKA